MVALAYMMLGAQVALMVGIVWVAYLVVQMDKQREKASQRRKNAKPASKP